MLENLGKPVILTGAVVPFHEVYSDARRNLALSINLAAEVKMNEGNVHKPRTYINYTDCY